MMIELPIVDTKKTDLQFVENPLAMKSVQMGISPEQLAFQSLTLEEILKQISNLPAETAVLGLGEDGVPLLFDLRDARPGPILVLGDKFCGKTQLLLNLAESLIRRNQSNEVQFAVLSGKPEQWKDLNRANPEYFLHLHSNYEHSAATTILELCDLVEARQHGQAIDRSVVFILDGMDTVPYMDFGIRMNFEWLLKEGPALRVWPLASLDSESALQQMHWVNRFRTRLIGSISQEGRGRELSLSNEMKPAELIPGQQFAVRLNRTWLKFHLPG